VPTTEEYSSDEGSDGEEKERGRSDDATGEYAAGPSAMAMEWDDGGAGGVGGRGGSGSGSGSGSGGGGGEHGHHPHGDPNAHPRAIGRRSGRRGGGGGGGDGGDGGGAAEVSGGGRGVMGKRRIDELAPGGVCPFAHGGGGDDAAAAAAAFHHHREPAMDQVPEEEAMEEEGGGGGGSGGGGSSELDEALGLLRKMAPVPPIAGLTKGPATLRSWIDDPARPFVRDDCLHVVSQVAALLAAHHKGAGPCTPYLFVLAQT